MEDQSQPDPVKAFQGLPRERQSALLQKMTPDQKTKLMGAIKAKGGKISGGAGGSYTPFTTGQKVARTAADVLPTVTAGVGAGVGSLAGPAGSIGGAAIGGALGEQAAIGVQRMAKLPEAPQGTGATLRAIGEEGAAQGALQGFGEGSSALFSKMGKAAAGRVLPLVNKYIGLKVSDLPVWERLNVKGANEVAQTVLEKVGIKKTLPLQKEAIESVRSNVNQQTETLINSVPPLSTYIDHHRMINRIANDLWNEFDLRGKTPEAYNALFKNADSMIQQTSPYGFATPQKLFQIRKEIQKEINWTNVDPTDVRQMFLQKLYPELNTAIKDSLPPSQARQFANLNRIQNRLIIARDAAGEKLTKEAVEPKAGLASLGKRAVAGAALGGGIGAAFGAATGREHTGEEAAGGAVAGATLAAVGFHGRAVAHGLESPRGDIALAKFGAYVDPLLSKAAKISPQAARALSIVRKTQKDLSDREPGR